MKAINPRIVQSVYGVYKSAENNEIKGGAVVAAQLAERLLLTPEIHGSNPIIGK